MRIVMLGGSISSSVFGGNTGGQRDDYLHGEEGQRLVGDADAVVALWTPSSSPVVVRAPEGVTFQALSSRTTQRKFGGRGHGPPEWDRDVKLHDSITVDEFIEDMLKRHTKDVQR